MSKKNTEQNNIFEPEKKQSKREKNPKDIYHIKGGLVELPDGTLTKTKMFDILDVPLDDYSDLTFSQEEVRRMRMHAMNMRTGVQAMIPIICLGPVKCPFRMRCPIVDRSKRTSDGQIDFAGQNVKKFPIMRMCPIERDFLNWKRTRYVEEYDIDVESPTELGMANKLAELDLFEYRLNLQLANGDVDGDGPTLLKEQVTGISMTGQEIKKLEEHPALLLKDKLHKQRMEILNSLVGTRKEQYKKEAALKKTDIKDPSNSQAEVRKLVEQLGGQTVVDVEFKELEPALGEDE